jgi:hypothetical protein
MEHAAYMREWYEANKGKCQQWINVRREMLAKWYNQYRLTIGPCESCGESDWRCIDLHHIDPVTKTTPRGGISQCIYRGWSIERMIEEIKKCRPLCVNCHRMEHSSLEPKNKGINQRRESPTDEELKLMTKERRYYWKNQAKSCQTRAARHAALVEWYKETKSAGGCLNCKETRYPCLDYHHKDPKTKRHSVSHMVWKCHAKDAVITEISKCVLLCGNCHRKTEPQKPYPPLRE